MNMFDNKLRVLIQSPHFVNNFIALFFKWVNTQTYVRRQFIALYRYICLLYYTTYSSTSELYRLRNRTALYSSAGKAVLFCLQITIWRCACSHGVAFQSANFFEKKNKTDSITSAQWRILSELNVRNSIFGLHISNETRFIHILFILTTIVYTFWTVALSRLINFYCGFMLPLLVNEVCTNENFRLFPLHTENFCIFSRRKFF